MTQLGLLLDHCDEKSSPHCEVSLSFTQEKIRKVSRSSNNDQDKHPTETTRHSPLFKNVFKLIRTDFFLFGARRNATKSVSMEVVR
jgi:hypothetical protein